MGERLQVKIDAKEQAWMDDAICKGMDSSIFFPVKGADTFQAVLICNHCPVKDECLEYALQFGYQLNGVWGGTSARERRRILITRRRANELRNHST